MKPATVIIALGSNRASTHGRPADGVHAAIAALADAGLAPKRLSPIMKTRAVGPGGRDYANAVMTSKSRLKPLEIFDLLKKIEAEFGRRGARKWGARVLDLDLIACGDRVWPSRLGWATAPDLAVPHRSMHTRGFVLHPMLAVAPDWRHPIFNLTTRQMLARMAKAARNG